MKRAILFLTVLLILQLAVLAATSVTGRTTLSATGRLVLDGVTADQVARISIRDNADKSVTLKRQSEGWVVASAGDYPSEKDKVDKLLKALCNLTSEGVAALSSVSHRGFGVHAKGAERTIELYSGEDKLLAQVFLGNGGGQFVRRDGDDQVYRVGERLSWQASTAATGYIDTALLSFDTKKVTDVVWQDGTDTQPVLALKRLPTQMPDVSPTREGEEAPEAPAAEWALTAPQAAAADRDKVEQCLSSLSRLRFAEPAGKDALPEHGLPPAAGQVLEITLEDNEKIVLNLGAKTDDGGLYVQLGGSSFVVKVASWSATQLTKTGADFKPTPPPADEPTDQDEGPAPVTIPGIDPGN